MRLASRPWRRGRGGDGGQRPSSIGGRLRTGFAFFVILLAGAGAIIYVGFAHQQESSRQLNGQFYVLRHYVAQLDDDFADAQVAVANYELTFEHRFLTEYDGDGANFANDLVVVRRYAPPSMRGLIDQQGRAGAAWFTLANQIVEDPAYTAGNTVPTDRAWATSERFKAANTAMAGRISATVNLLIRQSNNALSVGLAWSAGALAVAIGLGLAIAAGTVRRTLGPLRRLTATVNRLTAGDHDARIQAAGPREIQEVARAVNALADESDQLRRAEAESNRLRAMARETGFLIREHLNADDVILAARAALKENLDADMVRVHFILDGKLTPAEGQDDYGIFPSGFFEKELSPGRLRMLDDLLKTQSSGVIQNMRGPEGDRLQPEIREPLREAGVVAHLITPFGVGTELLGMIAADRMQVGHPWTAAEVDAVESIAADLGRGLRHARLYEEENRLVGELRSIDRAKSDFVATVSHELRTPLTSITGYMEMMLDRELGELSAEQEHTLERVSRNAVRLQDLIEDLLTLSAIEAGTFTTVARPVSLLDIIAGAAEDIAPAAAAKGLTLTTALPADGLVVDGDANQLARVLMNLLSNAVKFTPEGGRIELTAEAAGGWAVVSVADTGIGIPDADKKDLFTRFFRASNATQQAIQGTGLGLAIIQTIIAGHGGELTLQSQEGAGTAITVRLPLAESWLDKPADQHPPHPVPVPGASLTSGASA
jgi:two-component system, OmpR family, phosphate regulon sensor histidine kinase PhoR